MRIGRSGILLVALAAIIVAVGAGPVSAQMFRGGPTGFLDRLFGRDREVAPPPGAIPNAPRTNNRGKPTAPARKKQAVKPSEPAYPVAEIQPKDPDAKKILVVGDFIASGLAWGLDQAFADEPRVMVVDRGDGSSGFVRDDHYDWAAMLPDLLNAEKPDMTVVMIGANDRQPMRTADGRFAPRSEEWQKLYQQRVDRFLLALQAYGKPVYWVGEPPMQSADSSADMAYLNTLFKARADAVGADFVDVWDGFADEDGKFVTRGPDVDGQMRQLRSSDGINFTKAGRRKLAFYVERELRRTGGVGPAAGTAALLNPNETTEIGPDGKARLVGPIVSLTDPAPGAADAPLAGAAPQAPAVESAAYKLAVEGEAPPAPAGRADNFAWTPPGASESAEPVRKSIVDGIVIRPADNPD